MERKRQREDIEGRYIRGEERQREIDRAEQK
jgi:hypothetical protein